MIFVKGGFYRCINNVVSYVRVVAPDAPLERITEASVMAEFSRQWEEAKVELSGLSDQILEQMKCASCCASSSLDILCNELVVSCNMYLSLKI